MFQKKKKPWASPLKRGIALLGALAMGIVPVAGGITAKAAESVTKIQADSNEDLWKSNSSWTKISTAPDQLNVNRMETTGHLSVKTKGGALSYVGADGILQDSDGSTLTLYYDNKAVGGIGEIGGRAVGMKVVFSQIQGAECSGETVDETGTCPVVEHFGSLGAEMHKSGIVINSNFWGGYTQHAIYSMKETYTLYYLDSGETISQKGAHVTVNSLNKGEGVAYLTEGTEAKDLKTTVRKDNNLINRAYGVWAGASNDFVDDTRDPSFTKNSVSFELHTDEPSFRMSSDSADYWHTYTVAPLVASIPSDPAKVGILDGGDVERFDKAPIGRELTFEVRQKAEQLGVTGSLAYKQFALLDQLPKELTYKDASVSYVLPDGTRKPLGSGEANITVNNGLVRAELAESYLQGKDMPYQMETYALQVKAVVNDKASLVKQFTNEGWSVVNHKEQKRQTVGITPLNPALSIVKESPRYEYKVGEKVPYKVKVSQTVDGAIARNVTASDLSLPEGLKAENAKVSGVAGASIQKEGAGWRATAPALKKWETLTITFDAMATDGVNTKETVNEAQASADNAPVVKDQEEAYINSAALSLKKTASQGEWRVGDAVDYTVTVQNEKPGSIANNVQVSDLTLPKGLELMDAPKVTGAPPSVIRPVKNDKLVHGETREEPVTARAAKDGNSWNASLSALPTGVPVAITFHCRALEAVNGMEVINTAHAKADNAPDVKDDAKIWINSPELKLKKKADMKKVRVGDIITYTLSLTNEKAGTVAHDAVIEDALDENCSDFVKLQKNSIVLLDSEGNKIEDARIAVKGNSFHIDTGKNLVSDQSGYGIWNLEAGKKPQDGGKPNPEGVKKETKLQVEYQVKVTSDLAAGETIRNAATATSREDIPAKAEEDVQVRGPHLDVEKTSDKQAYGDKGVARYEITVRQTREGYQARNVTVKDRIEPQGAAIDKDSITLKVNGKKILPISLKMDEDGQGYAMETGVTLDDEDKMKITYDVRFDELPDKNQDKQFVNQVVAKGSNTNESKNDHAVTVTKKDAALSVAKTSDRGSYLVGDTAKYDLSIYQKIEDAAAKQVVVKDAFVQDGMAIQKDTIKVSVNGKEITPKALALNEAKNGFLIQTGADLSDRDKMEVAYDVVFEKPIDGERADNRATVHAENANEKMSVQSVNVRQPAPALLVQKQADKNTYTVGDRAKYVLNITETKKYATAKQVEIRDAFVQDGMAIQKDTVKISVNGKEITPKALALNEAKNGFLIQTGADLSDPDKMTVTYDVVFEKPAEGGTALNTAAARADNAPPAKGDFKIRLISPELSLDKKADKTEAKQGDKLTYTLLVTGKGEEGVKARNIHIKDALSYEGAVLLPETIQITDKDGRDVTKDCKITADKNGFTLDSKKDLKTGEAFVLTYDVKLEKALPGDTVENQAYAWADNAPEAKAQAQVAIPTLADVVKTGLKNHAALYAGIGGALLLAAGGLLLKNLKRKDGEEK